MADWILSNLQRGDWIFLSLREIALCCVRKMKIRQQTIPISIAKQHAISIPKSKNIHLDFHLKTQHQPKIQQHQHNLSGSRCMNFDMDNGCCPRLNGEWMLSGFGKRVGPS